MLEVTTPQARGGLESKEQSPYLPRSSEKFIPSLILPPTTESSRAPVICPPVWLQHCRRGISNSNQSKEDFCVSETIPHLGYSPPSMLTVPSFAAFPYPLACHTPTRLPAQLTFMHLAYSTSTCSTWLAFLGS